MSQSSCRTPHRERLTPCGLSFDSPSPGDATRPEKSDVNFIYFDVNIIHIGIQQDLTPAFARPQLLLRCHGFAVAARESASRDQAA
jgi:hypothetical protein